MKALVTSLGICVAMALAVGGCGSDDEEDTGTGGTSGSGGGSQGGSGGGSQGGTGGGNTGGTAGAATGGAAGAATGGAAGGGGSAGAGALTCAGYCTVYTANCTDANYEYDDNDDCLDECSGWDVGTVADQDGNTLGCHTYHAGAAAGSAANATLHCPHAGPTGGNVCVDP